MADDPSEAREQLAGLLRAAAARDRAALSEIYRRTSAKLLGVCLRILPQREEAEDVLQEVYLAVWDKAHTFDPRLASPMTWLAAIARNRAIDRLRALKRRPAAALPEDFEIADETPDAQAGLELSQDYARLRGCLEGLEPRTRGAISSAFFGGHTYAALAEKGGVPLGTMKTWIRRGLSALKECIGR